VSLARKAALLAIADNEHLEGDDCKSSRQYLLGYAATLYKGMTAAKTAPSDEEEEEMIGVFSKFLHTDVNKSLRLLDAIVNVFVFADQDLEHSTCECCKAKRELLPELREAGLLKD